jgi:hypothetical protein
MGKVGRFVTGPKAGAYGQIVLDSGEKIIVDHHEGGFQGGRLLIEAPKFMGFSSDRLLAYVKDCQSVADANTRDAALRSR